VISVAGLILVRSSGVVAVEVLGQEGIRGVRAVGVVDLVNVPAHQLNVFLWRRR
jgi:hypothetical protein